MATLTFPLEQQCAKNWCWIACAVCVDHYYDGASQLTQCTLANALLGQSTCCTDPSTDVCNKTGQLAQSLGYIQRLRIDVGTPVLYSGIQTEIDATDPVGHPVCAGIQWEDIDEGHAVVIYGYDTVNGTDFLYIADPGTNTIHHVPFSTFLTNYLGRGRWTETAFTER